jgi:hypothetical protein
MNGLVFVLPLLALGLTSCDKAKEAVAAAREKIEGVKDTSLPKPPGGEVASTFVPQVDTAAEGVRFRRDLPFPSDVEVRVTHRVTFHNTRRIVSSALGTDKMTANGAFEIVGFLQRSGPQLSLTIEKAGPVVDPKDAVEKAKASAQGAPPPDPEPFVGTRAEFQLGKNGWFLPAKKGPVEFNSKVLEQNLLPNVSGLLIQHGIMPRKQWFSSSRRWIGGDKLVLEGDSLALLFENGATGKVTLTYEVSEALDGHPCGRFAVQGDVSLKNETMFDGSSQSGEMTIQSGKVWCSLLHPLVLREEYQTVRTVTEGQGNGPKTKVQGGIDELRVRQWKGKGE